MGAFQEDQYHVLKVESPKYRVGAGSHTVLHPKRRCIGLNL